MSNLIQLEDLLGIYPSQDDEDFQALITRKKEFADLWTTAEELTPQRGFYFRHQQFVQRFMRYFDKLLVMHRTGTGKTCAAVAVSEMYKKIKDADHGIGTSEVTITKCTVLVKGDLLEGEFQDQLVCKCTVDSEYEMSEEVRRATTQKDQKTKVTKAIKEFYEINTYETFARELSRMSDLDIIERYSGRLFIVDEVHNLRESEEDYDDDTGSRRTRDASESLDIYDQFWRLFHLVQRSKILLLSATPMINRPEEVKYVLNLLLPADNQMSPSLDMETITLEEFEVYARGKISFVREMDTGLDVEYVGEPVISYQPGMERFTDNIVFSSEMSDFQAEAYVKSLNEKTPFNVKTRQASNFVFPDGTYGQRGYDRFMKTDVGRERLRQAIVEDYEDDVGLKKYSCKYNQIIASVIDAPGNCFCYSDFLKGSGQELLAFCFEAFGFEKFESSTSVFVSQAELQSERRNVKPFCSASEMSKNRRLKPGFEEKPRYAILANTTKNSQSDAIKELFNSPENMHGEYLKVLIGTPKSRDGLNLANVVEIHLVGPTWNTSSAYQAISRGIRATSHINLLQEKRVGKKNEDGTWKVPPDEFGRVKVRIYKHSAILPPEYQEEGVESIDQSMYIHAQLKDRAIKRIERMMKQCAVDCQIHKERNQRQGSDYSSACDYDVCTYRCFNEIPAEDMGTDITTERVFYSQDAVAEAMDGIIRLLKTVKAGWTLDELYVYLETDPLYVDLAVDNLVSSRTTVRDKFGFLSYVREDRGSVFLDREYPAEMNDLGRYSLWKYSSELITTSSRTFGDISTATTEAVILENIDITDVSQLDELDIDARVKVVEAALTRVVNDSGTDLDREIVDKFQHLIFEFIEPTEALRKTSLEMSKKGKKRGRRSATGTKPRKIKKPNIDISKFDFSISKTNEPVYMHMVYVFKADRIFHNVRANYLKADSVIRVYKKSEGRWRDAGPDEQFIYSLMIQDRIAERVQRFEEMEVYGFLSQQDNKFRIVDQKKRLLGGEEEDEASDPKRGKICTTFTNPPLFDSMYRAGIQIPEDAEVPTYKEALKFMEKLNMSELGEGEDDVRKWPKDKVIYFYVWYKRSDRKKQGKDKGKREICEYIQDVFTREGKLLTV